MKRHKLSRPYFGPKSWAATAARVAQSNSGYGFLSRTAAMVCGVAAGLLAPNTWAQLQTHTQTYSYTDANSFLVQAIRTGQSSGVLIGPIDEHFSRHFNSSGALHVKARVLRDLARPDCKHLEVVYAKDGVHTPKGSTQAILTTELDYCLSGEPPMVQGMVEGQSKGGQ